MKHLFAFITSATVLFYACQSPVQEAAEEVSVVHDGIRWSGDNETANYLAAAGRNHFINVEFDKAYTLSEHAVQLDSSLFASHTLLAFLSQGAKKEHHKSMATKYSAGENETGKLFVSLLDIENDSTGDQRRKVWAKMRALSNGPFIHHMYARTMDLRADTAAVLRELDNVIAFCEENGMTGTAAATYNIKGYLLQRTGDLEGGTKAIERYVELYPDGYNPIDSRAEFYLFAGDKANAVAWYKKVLEKYPFSQSAREQLKELEAQK